MKNFILTSDRNGLLWLTEFRHPYLNRAMELFSRAGDWDASTFLIAGLLAVKGKPRRIGLRVLPRVLGALAICFGLKRLARRARPSIAVEGFSALLIDPDPYSFPSSHSACSWALSVSAARAMSEWGWGLGWLLCSYAALVSYSRIHVGAHYPVDVLIGTTIGAVIGLPEKLTCIAGRS